MGKKLIFLCFLLSFILSCTRNTELEIIKAHVRDIGCQFAPDKRTALFHINVEKQKVWILKGETNLPRAKQMLLSALEENNINYADKIIVLPLKENNKNNAVINVSVANLRAHPTHSAELVTQALLGTPVNVLKQSDGWCLVQTPDKYIAWTNKASLQLMDKNAFEKWKSADKIIYLKTSGHSIKDGGPQRVSDLVAGAVLSLNKEYERHWAVAYPDGRQAMIHKEEGMILADWKKEMQISDASIIREAEALMGVPYLWGGTSTKGVDCSGFTKTVYFMHGIILPRDASQQIEVGVLIDTLKAFESLQVGDLLFFGRKNEDGSERATHVGLWMGDNQFIHASGDVHLGSVDTLSEHFDAYNYSRYLRTKRILGQGISSLPAFNDFY